MAQVKQTGQGTILRYRPLGSTDAAAWKIIHSATEIGFSAERGSVDVTTHSTLGNFREFVPENLADPGEVTMTCFYEQGNASPASSGNLMTNQAHNGLITSVGDSGQVWEFVLAPPKVGANPTSHTVAPPTDRTTHAFSGFLTSVSVGIPIEGRPTFEITIKRTGAVTINEVN